MLKQSLATKSVLGRKCEDNNIPAEYFAKRGSHERTPYEAWCGRKPAIVESRIATPTLDEDAIWSWC